MKLTWKEMDALITNGILAYEPYGSYYCLDNNGLLMSSAMSATSDKPSNDWGYIDFDLVSDAEHIVLEEFLTYLGLRQTMGSEEVQA